MYTNITFFCSFVGNEDKNDKEENGMMDWETKHKTGVAESWELEIKNRRAEVITESKYKLRTNVMESAGNAVNMRRRKDKRNHRRGWKEEKE